MEKLDGFIGNRTHDLPVCSILSQPTTLPRAPRYLLASTARFFSRVIKLIIADKLNSDQNQFKAGRLVFDSVRVSCEIGDRSK
jgi:hypothetical protein